jgi:hypothetical protein
VLLLRLILCSAGLLSAGLSAEGEETEFEDQLLVEKSSLHPGVQSIVSPDFLYELPTLEATPQAPITIELPDMEVFSFVPSADLEDANLGDSASWSLLGAFSTGGYVCHFYSQPERILFAIDLNSESASNPAWVDCVIQEMVGMVGRLSTGTLINVMVFQGKRVQFFQPELVPAQDTLPSVVFSWLQSLQIADGSPELRQQVGVTADDL